MCNRISDRRLHGDAGGFACPIRRANRPKRGEEHIRTCMTLNLHVYPSNFTHETRILKETKSLADHGVFDRIVICALWSEGLAEHEPLDGVREVWRVKAPASAMLKGLPAKVARTLTWFILIFSRFRREPVACVNCHSWSILPLGLVFKAFTRSKIVYDTHELETETNTSRTQRVIAKLIEATCIRYVDTIIVVSDSIAAWYRQRYRRKPIEVVRNIPHRRSHPVDRSSILKDKLAIRGDEILFIYQGTLGHGRNIPTLLRVFARAAQRKHIVFLGFGELASTVKEQARLYPNIHFHPSVPPAQVLSYTASADVGIHIIDNTCLNHYYCLPNKIFEYLSAGLPQVVSDFPEMSKIISAHGCGWTTSVVESDVLALVNRITHADIALKRENAMQARHAYGWENEEALLLRAYEPLHCASINRRGAAATACGAELHSLNSAIEKAKLPDA